MGYVDSSRGGVTELRVHGVSGTPPEALLDHPHTRRVAGNADAGFHRRVWESPATSQDGLGRGADGGVDRLEGYSWGGLTSGGWSRALYLLLLPFLLVNVGSFATPRSPLGERGGWLVVRRLSEGVQRLLALSLTLTLTLATVEVSVDMVGWQCGRDAATCGTGPLVGVPDWSWLRDTGPRITATALVPLAVVLLLWWLAHRTWWIAEAVVPPVAPGTQSAWVTPLEDRSFWNGGEAVANLRAFHITAALAAVGLAVTTPALVAPGGGISALWSSPSVPHRILATIFLVGLAACAAGVAAWPLAARPAPVRTARPRPRVGGWRSILPASALALVVVAGAFTALGGTAPSTRRPVSVLPWLSWGINVVFWSQVGLVALLTVLTAVQARSSATTRPVRPARPVPAGSGEDGSGTDIETSPAWRGMALPAFALLGWLVASGFAAALALRIADVVGTPVAAVDAETSTTLTATSGQADPSTGKQILLPVGYFWASAAAVLVVVVVLLVAVALAVSFMRSIRALQGVVATRYGVDPASSPETQERVRAIARAWAIGLAPNRARSLAAGMVVGTALVLVAGLAGYALDQQWIVDRNWAALLAAGNLVMTLAVAALVYAGRQAYTNPRFRRTIGILWDVGTFWPRATHPLAPPSYGERAVPDLLGRVEALAELGEGALAPDPARRDLVVLSCHSQGSVIGAAVVAASSYAALARTAFLTYGNPLRRLYARFFPAYFGPQQLDRLGRLLVARDGDDAPATAAPTVEQRTLWPWRSLQRPSDFIGGPMFRDAPPTLTAPPRAPGSTGPVVAGDVDVTLLDPVFARARGDRAWPSAHAHSDYPLDPLFDVVRTDVVQLRAAPRPPAPERARDAEVPPAPRTSAEGPSTVTP